MIFATSYNTIDGHGTLLERAIYHENAFITLLQYIKPNYIERATFGFIQCII